MGSDANIRESKAGGAIARSSFRGLIARPFKWFGSLLVGYTVMSDVIRFYNVATWIDTVVKGYIAAFDHMGNEVVAALAAITGSSVGQDYRLMVPVLLQLTVVLALAFVQFGWRSYWIRASASPGVRVRLNYVVHLVFILVLVGLIAVHVSQEQLTGANIWERIAAFRAPASVLDYAIAGYAGLALFVLVFWHPGIAMRVMGLVVGIKILVDWILPVLNQAIGFVWPF